MKKTGILFAVAVGIATLVGSVGTAHAGVSPTFDATFSCDDHGDLYITVHLTDGGGKVYDLTIETATKFGPYDDGDYHVLVMEGDKQRFVTTQPVTCWAGAEVLANCFNGEPSPGDAARSVGSPPIPCPSSDATRAASVRGTLR